MRAQYSIHVNDTVNVVSKMKTLVSIEADFYLTPRCFYSKTMKKVGGGNIPNPIPLSLQPYQPKSLHIPSHQAPHTEAISPIIHLPPSPNPPLSPSFLSCKRGDGEKDELTASITTLLVQQFIHVSPLTRNLRFKLTNTSSPPFYSYLAS